jgi:hypothetical protein
MVGEKGEIRPIVCRQRRCGGAENAGNPVMAHSALLGASCLADPCSNREAAHCNCHRSVAMECKELLYCRAFVKKTKCREAAAKSYLSVITYIFSGENFVRIEIAIFC